MVKEYPAYAARARYLPFAVFMAFIGIDEIIRFAASKGLLTTMETTLYFLYPVKTVVVAALLFHYRQAYTELSLKDLARLPVTAVVCLTGNTGIFSLDQYGLGTVRIRQATGI